MNITADEILLAKSGQEILKKKKAAKLVLDDRDVELSPTVLEVLKKTLSYIAQGKSVVVTPEPNELTTQQAADFLRVSRPFLVKLWRMKRFLFTKSAHIAVSDLKICSTTKKELIKDV